MDKDRSLPVQALAKEGCAPARTDAVVTLTPAERTEHCFHAYGTEVFGVIARLCGSEADAEEVTQEAFLRLHQALSSGETIDNPRAWLHAIARNLIISRVRQRMRRGVHFEQQVAAMLIDAASAQMPGPDRQYAEQERRLAFVRELRSLSDEERTLLSERAAGLPLRVIAARHGWTDFRRAGARLTALVKRLRARIRDSNG